MRFNLISNWSNGVGLQRDGVILRELLESHRQRVNLVDWKQTTAPFADINLFSEVVCGDLLRFARRQWVVPNPEWWLYSYNQFIPQIDLFLAKTRDCFRIFSAKAGAERCRYLGWKALDFYDSAVPRQPRFLHVAGQSKLKNTRAVLEAWQEIDAALTLVSEHYRSGNPRVESRHRVSEPEMKYFLNSHRFHILPAAYEGYGHALHESMGVNAVVITTDAPPMNEIGATHLVPRQPDTCTGEHYLAPLYRVSAEDVRRTVSLALTSHAQSCTRERFLQDERDFLANLDSLLAEAAA